VSAPHALEPGTVLVDRYRLEEQQGRTGDTTYWRATDELLDRPVGVCLLPADGATAAPVLHAARQAAAVTDPRFLRVLDAAETDGIVYVVSEWVTATSLADLVTDRVLPPPVARDLAVEVAGALGAAHEQGLAHLCLTPEHVLRTAHGTVKVAGLAVDAAASGVTSDDDRDAAARDTRGVAAILYAALTSRWPGEAPSRLGDAPIDAGRLCSPRQVKAGVPDDLDGIVADTLDAGPRHHHPPDDPPARTPAELSRRLIGTATTGRMAAIRPAAELPGDTPPPYATRPYVATYDDEGPARGRLAGRLAYLLVALVLAAGLGLGGYQLATGGNLGGASASDDPSSSSNATPSPSTRVLTIAGATGFDPEGDGEENSDRAERAVDGSRSTFWNTKTYLQQLGPGGLKDGVGLLLDLGSQQPVRQVTVRTNLDPTTIQVRTAPVSAGTQLGDFGRVARMTTAHGTGTARLSGARVRYLLLWITELPQEGPQAFRTEISQVSVRG
jgi:hypothetical protein